MLTSPKRGEQIARSLRKHTALSMGKDWFKLSPTHDPSHTLALRQDFFDEDDKLPDNCERCQKFKDMLQDSIKKRSNLNQQIKTKQNEIDNIMEENLRIQNEMKSLQEQMKWVIAQATSLVSPWDRDASVMDDEELLPRRLARSTGQSNLELTREEMFFTTIASIQKQLVDAYPHTDTETGDFLEEDLKQLLQAEQIRNYELQNKMKALVEESRNEIEIKEDILKDMKSQLEEERAKSQRMVKILEKLGIPIEETVVIVNENASQVRAENEKVLELVSQIQQWERQIEAEGKTDGKAIKKLAAMLNKTENFDLSLKELSSIHVSKGTIADTSKEFNVPSTKNHSRNPSMSVAERGLERDKKTIELQYSIPLEQETDHDSDPEFLTQALSRSRKEDQLSPSRRATSIEQSRTLVSTEQNEMSEAIISQLTTQLRQKEAEIGALKLTIRKLQAENEEKDAQIGQGFDYEQEVLHLNNQVEVLQGKIADLQDEKEGYQVELIKQANKSSELINEINRLNEEIEILHEKNDQKVEEVEELQEDIQRFKREIEQLKFYREIGEKYSEVLDREIQTNNAEWNQVVGNYDHALFEILMALRIAVEEKESEAWKGKPNEVVKTIKETLDQIGLNRLKEQGTDTVIELLNLVEELKMSLESSEGSIRELKAQVEEREAEISVLEDELEKEQDCLSGLQKEHLLLQSMLETFKNCFYNLHSDFQSEVRVKDEQIVELKEMLEGSKINFDKEVSKLKEVAEEKQIEISKLEQRIREAEDENVALSQRIEELNANIHSQGQTIEKQKNENEQLQKEILDKDSEIERFLNQERLMNAKFNEEKENLLEEIQQLKDELMSNIAEIQRLEQEWEDSEALNESHSMQIESLKKDNEVLRREIDTLNAKLTQTSHEHEKLHEEYQNKIHEGLELKNSLQQQISALSVELENKKNENASLKEEIINVNEQLLLVTARANNQQEEIDSNERKLEENRIQVNKFEEQVRESSLEIQALQQQMKELAEIKKELEQQLEAETLEKNAKNTENRNLFLEIANLKDKIVSLSEVINKQMEELAIGHRRIEEERATVGKLEQQLAEANNKATTLTQQLEDLTAHNEAQNKTIVSEKSENERLRKEILSRDEEIVSQRAMIEQNGIQQNDLEAKMLKIQQELRDSKAIHENQSAQIESMKSDNEVLRQEIEVIHVKLVQLGDEYKKYQEESQKQSQEASELKNELQVRISSLSGEIENKRIENEKMVEEIANLQEKIQLLTTEASEGQKERNVLREKIEENQSELTGFKEKLKESSLERQALEQQLKVLEENKLVIEKELSVRILDNNTKTDEIQAHIREISNLKETIDGLSEKFSNQKGEITSKQVCLEEKQAEISRLEERLKAANEKEIALSQQVKDLAAQNEAQNQATANEKSENERLRQELSNRDEEIASQKALIEQNGIQQNDLAAEMVKLQQDLKDSKICNESLSTHIESLKTENKSLHHEIEELKISLQQQTSALNLEIEIKINENKKMEEEIVNLQEKIQLLTTQVNNHQEEIDLQKEKLEENQTELNGLKEKLAQSSLEKQALQQRLKELEDSKQALEQELSARSLENRSKTDEIQAHIQKISNLKEKIVALSGQISNQQEEISRLEEQLSTAKEKETTLSQQIGDLTAQNESQRKTIENEKSQSVRLRQELLSRDEEIATQKALIEQNGIQKNDLAAELQKVQQELKVSKAMIENHSTQIESLKVNNDALRCEIDTLNTNLVQINQQHKEIQEELQNQIKEGLELKNSLQQQINALNLEIENKRNDCDNNAKEIANLREQVLDLTTRERKQQEEINVYQEKLKEKQSELADGILKKQALQQRIKEREEIKESLEQKLETETLEKKTIYDENQNLLQEIANLKEQIASLLEKISQKEVDLVRRQREIEEKLADILKLDEQLKEATNRAMILSQQIEELNAATESHKQVLENKKSEIESLYKELKTKNEEITAQKALIEQREVQLKGIESNVQILQQELHDSKTVNENYSIEIGSLKAENGALQSGIEMANAKLVQIGQEYEKLKDESQSQIRDGLELNNSLQQQIAALTSEIESQREENDNMAKEISNMQEKIQLLTADSGQQLEKLSLYQGKLEEKQTELAALEVKLKEAGLEKQTLQQQVKELEERKQILEQKLEAESLNNKAINDENQAHVQEIARLKEKITLVSERADHLQAELTTYQHTIEEKQAGILKLEEKFNEASNKAAALSQRIEELVATTESQRQVIENNKCEIERLHKEIDSKLEEITVHKTLMEQKETQLLEQVNEIKKLHQELQDSKISNESQSAQIESLKADNEALYHDIEALNTKLEYNEQEYKRTQEESRKQIHEGLELTNSLQQQINSLSTEIESKKNENGELAKEIANSHEKISLLTAEAKKQLEDINSQKAKLEEKQTELIELQGIIKDKNVQINELTSSKQALEQQLALSELENNRKTEENQASLQEISNLKEKITSLSETINSLQAELIASQKNMEERQAEVSKLDQRLKEADDSIINLTHQREELKTHAESQRQALDHEKSENDRIHNELTFKDAEIMNLKALVDQRDSQIEEIRSQESISKTKFTEQIGALTEEMEKLKNDQTNHLTEIKRLQQELEDSRTTCENQIETLKADNGSLRCEIEELNLKLVQINQEHKKLQEDSQHQIQDGLEMKSLLEQQIATLNSEIESKKHENSHLANEIATLQEKIQMLTDQANKQEEEINSYKRKLEEKQTELTDFEEKLKIETQKCKSLSAQVKDLTFKAQLHTQWLDTNREEVDNLQKELTQKTSEFNSQKTMLNQLNLKVKEFESKQAKMNELAEEVSKLKGELMSKVTENQKLVVENKVQKARTDRQQQEIEILKQKNADLEHEYEEYKLKTSHFESDEKLIHARFEKQIKDGLDQKNEFEQQLAITKNENGKLTEEVNSLKGMIDPLNDKIKSQEEELKARQQRIIGQNFECVGLEAKLNEFKEKNRVLTEKITTLENQAANYETQTQIQAKLHAEEIANLTTELQAKQELIRKLEIQSNEYQEQLDTVNRSLLELRFSGGARRKDSNAGGRRFAEKPSIYSPSPEKDTKTLENQALIDKQSFNLSHKYVVLNNGEKIAYIEDGPKDAKYALIALHTNATTSYVYLDFIARMRDFIRVIAIDLRGHGKSTYIRPFKKIDDLSNDLHEFILELNLKSVSLIGWSLGGGICLKYGMDHPEMVNKLILHASVGLRGWSCEGEVYDAESILENPSIEMFMEQVDDENIEFIEETYGPFKNLLGPEKFLEFCEQVLKERARQDSFYLIGGMDLSEAVEKLEAKVLIVHGINDEVCPVKLAKETAKALGEKATLDIWDSVGHMLLAEAPEKMARAVKRFLLEGKI